MKVTASPLSAVPPAPDAPVVAAPPATSAPPPTAPARTGDWVRGVDVVLAILAVAVAVLAAAVAARNSDLWLSLAGGRLILEGNLHLTGDPFTFSGAERVWVHSSWLTDVVFYLLYQLNPAGAALVALKTLLFAGAFALGLFLRVPGRSAAPWALFIAAGAIAAAPYVDVRPAVVSMPMLALTLVLIYRRLGLVGGWRGPLEIGLLTALWANLDAGCIFGPIAVACVLVGKLIDGRSERLADPEAWAGPPVKLLARALGLSVLGCLLNPYFISASIQDPAAAFYQMVPTELGVGVPAAGGELRTLSVGPFDPDFLRFRTRGPAVVSLGVLAVGGLIGLLASVRSLRASPVVLGVVFALLAVQHVRLVPYLAVVAAPIFAGWWNLAAARSRPGSEAAERITLTAATLGRVLLAVGLVALCALSYPGRLHPAPNPPDPALWRRVELAVRPDPGLMRAARAIQTLHTSGQLPADSRGVNTSFTIGNYAAFFAPTERTFVTSRFAFHRPELSDLAALRRGLLGSDAQSPAEQEAQFTIAEEVLTNRNVTHVVITETNGGSIEASLGGVFALAPPLPATARVRPNWSLVHLDGHAAVMARGAKPLDLVTPAFGPGVEPLPAGVVMLPPPRGLGLAGDYVTRAAPLPPEADDVAVLNQYLDLAGQYAQNDFIPKLRDGSSALGGMGVLFMPVRFTLQSDVDFAAPLLAIRAARQAIAAAPDRPEGYVALAKAYSMPGVMPLAESPTVAAVAAMSELELQRLTAFRRYLDRAALPTEATGAEQIVASLAIFELATIYSRTNQFDAAKEVLDLGEEYLRRMDPQRALFLALKFVPRTGAAPEPEKLVTEFRKNYTERQDELRLQVQRGEDRLQTIADPAQRFGQAVGLGLPLTALRVVESTPDLAAFGPARAQVEVQTVQLYIRTGQVEAAYQFLESRAESLAAAAARTPTDAAVQILSAARGVIARLTGDYAAARQALPSRSYPPPPPGFDPSQNWTDALFPAMALVGGSIGVASTPEGMAANIPLITAAAAFQFQLESLAEESVIATDRAMLALCEGKIPEAREALRQATTPQGIPLAKFTTPERAERPRRYLELIDRVNR